MSDITILASGLGFPEGPVVCADGSIVVVELRNQKISRVSPDGKVSLFSNAGGGPNGLPSSAGLTVVVVGAVPVAPVAVTVRGRVVVVGAGNTAMDCCRSSKRLGGEDVKVIVRSGYEEMKASPWEKEDAVEEGIPILNFLVPKEFKLENGKLVGMTFEKVKAEYDAKGRLVLLGYHRTGKLNKPGHFVPLIPEEERRIREEAIRRVLDRIHALAHPPG